MTSLAIPLAALLAFQGATSSTSRARECEPADNRCKAAMFARRAAATSSPKDRGLYLHAAHRSYLALFDQSGEEQHLCAARKLYEQSVAVEGQPANQRERFVDLLGDLTSREAKRHVRCARAAKGPAKAEPPRIARASRPSRPVPRADDPAPPSSPGTALTAATTGQVAADPDASSRTDMSTTGPRTASLLLEPARQSEPARGELMPVVRGPARTGHRSERRVTAEAERPGRGLVVAGGVTLGAGLAFAGVAGYLGGRLLDTRRQAQGLLAEIDGYANAEQSARNDALVHDYRRLGPPTLALALAGGASVVVAAVLLAVGGRRMARAPSRVALVPIPGGLALHRRF